MARPAIFVNDHEDEPIRFHVASFGCARIDDGIRLLGDATFETI